MTQPEEEVVSRRELLGLERERRLAVVTGASSGIGGACVGALVSAGFDVVGGARRRDRLQEVAEAAGARWHPLDVTDAESVADFVGRLDRCDVLVNNAGGSLGLDPIATADDERWRRMWETNVLGLVRMTRALLPLLERGGRERPGHVVNISSIAGIEVYRGGAGYSSAKHAVRAISRTLRLELLGHAVKVTDIAPGMVDTEFGLVRFGGDEQRAASVYRGLTPLRAEDVADCVTWVATRPPHVDVDELVVRPLDQATAAEVHRESP